MHVPFLSQQLWYDARRWKFGSPSDVISVQRATIASQAASRQER
jgi:hypothetical protein